MPRVTTIAIDCRFAGTGTGLARYTKELVAALLERHDGLEYVFIVRSADALPSIPSPHRMIVADIPHYSVAEHAKLPDVLRKSGATLAFFTQFNVPFFCPLPYVVTVHDLILHRHPGDASFLKRAMYRILMHRSLRHAKKVIAVSQWTKQDIRETYGPSVAKKTVVIGEGVSDAYVPQPLPRIDDLRRRYNLQKPFFLYVGNCKVHKNVPVLLEAFRRALPDAELILVSGGAESRALALPPNARLIEGVPNEDLPLFYAAARCFVTASLDEGYCLPVAEALACGCPVAASNRTAIPEILTGHGMLLEPTVEAFTEAFQNPPPLAAPVRVGSWEQAAEETAELLRTVA